MAGRGCQELSGGGASLAAGKGDPERSLSMVAFVVVGKSLERTGMRAKEKLTSPSLTGLRAAC
jgi:hypothetical protein